MEDRTPLSSASFYEILCRDFALLRAPSCASCEIPRPKRSADGTGWICAPHACEFGCHHLVGWMVAQYSRQYRPRDLCDTLS
jgi:hypothetical protein